MYTCVLNVHEYYLQDNNLRRTDSDSDICIDESQPVPSSIDPQVIYQYLI